MIVYGSVWVQLVGDTSHEYDDEDMLLLTSTDKDEIVEWGWNGDQLEEEANIAVTHDGEDYTFVDLYEFIDFVRNNG